MSTFVLITTSIILSAMPFMLLGAFVSSLIEVFIPEDFIKKIFTKNKFVSIIIGCFLGMIFPSCECGIVPVTRRFIKKGVPFYSAIAYMLCAPIVNPVSMISTYAAFKYSPKMMLFRVGGAVLLGFFISFIISFFNKKQVLVTEKKHLCNLYTHNKNKFHLKIDKIMHHTIEDFFNTGKYLIIGAFIAGLMKTIIPIKVLTVFANDNIMSILFMMIFSFVLSLCSNVDAFVAAAFTNFSFVSKLGFLILGPMLDIKLILMFSTTFKKKIIIRIAIMISIGVFLLSLFLSMFEL